MAGVTFDAATRVYPGSDTPAVAELDLEIEDGEFLVLVGPSGCGKSTTLRMLAGLEDGRRRARSGSATGTSPTLPPKDRDIAMVFQNYALYPHMTVAENMGFALKIARRAARTEIAARVAEAAKHPRPRASTSTASRRRCPAASGSGSRWAGRSCASRRCS